MLTSLALEPLKTPGVGVKGLLKRIVGKTAKYVEAKQCHVVTVLGNLYLVTMLDYVGIGKNN